MLTTEQWMLLVNILLFWLAPHARAERTHALNIQHCALYQNNIVNIPFIPYDTSLVLSTSEMINEDIVAQFMAGSKSECEQAIPIVCQAMNRDPFTQEMFKVLTGHPDFKMSLHTPKDHDFFKTATAMAVRGVHRFGIHFNLQNLHSEQFVTHESVHLLIGYIDAYFKGTLPSAVFPADINQIFIALQNHKHPEKKAVEFSQTRRKWKERFQHIIKIHSKSLQHLPLTKAEQTLLKKLYAAIKDKEPVVQVTVTEITPRAFQVGSSYSWEQLGQILGKTILEDHPKLYGNFTILEEKQLQDQNTKEIVFSCKHDPLVNVIVNRRLFEHSIPLRYAPQQHDEEFITHTLQLENAELINLTCPGLIENLSYGIELLRKEYPPVLEVISSAPAEDYLFYSDPPLLNGLNTSARNFPNILKKAIDCITKEEKSSVILAKCLAEMKYLLEKTLLYKLSFPVSHLQFIIAELHFLKADMRHSKAFFKNAVQNNKDIFVKPPYDLVNGWEHYNMAIKATNGMPPTNAQKRAAKRGGLTI